jgi:hypothetical protein
MTTISDKLRALAESDINSTISRLTDDANRGEASMRADHCRRAREALARIESVTTLAAETGYDLARPIHHSGWERQHEKVSATSLIERVTALANTAIEAQAKVERLQIKTTRPKVDAHKARWHRITHQTSRATIDVLVVSTGERLDVLVYRAHARPHLISIDHALARTPDDLGREVWVAYEAATAPKGKPPSLIEPATRGALAVVTGAAS